MVKNLREKTEESEKKNGESAVEDPKNQGKLRLDATCAPGDISYPFGFSHIRSSEKANRKNPRFSL